MRGALAGVAIMLLLASPATADAPAVSGQIAFDWGTNGLWVMNQDGSGRHKLADGRQPAWSADGKRIAYITGFGTSDYVGELAVMNADGSGQHLVDTDLGPNLASPSWSPDGKQIVVSAFGAYPFTADLYLVSLNGGRARLLVQDGTSPAWSPDGSRIAFVRKQTVMLAGSDGSGAHALTQFGIGNTSNARVAWSPDGKRIAFNSAQGSGIDAINVDGSGHVHLLQGGILSPSVPAWSPDGTRIAFLENADLCTASTDGTHVARLTYTPIDPGIIPSDPAWQPLPPGSEPAGTGGGSVGPPPDYPRGVAWYPSCDSPEQDTVTISSAGPSVARAGSWVTYTLRVQNPGPPISPVEVVDVLSTKVPGSHPSPSDGRCGPFSKSALPGQPLASECHLGAMLTGDTVTIRVRLRLTKVGVFTNTGELTEQPPLRIARTSTRVARVKDR